MAYPFYNTYGGMLPTAYQPYYNPLPSQNVTQTVQQGGGIIFVENAEEARAYAVAPLASVILMDRHASTFYIKSADASGMPTLRTFDFRERTAAQPSQAQAAPDLSAYVTRQELEQRLNALLNPAQSAQPANGGNVNEPSA